MKGLPRYPSPRQLQEVYNQIHSAQEIFEEQLALWSQYARLDPRLAEILVAQFSKSWEKINPVVLNRFLRKQVWPAAMGVLLEHVREFSLSVADEQLFRKWSECVMTGIEKAHYESFFFHTRAFGGEEMRKDALYSLDSYKVWGFFGRDILVNKAISKNKTLISAEARFDALKKLAQRRDRFSIKQYLEAAEGKVSRRQAELDLKACSFVTPEGSTRARTYRVRKKRIT